MGYLEVKKRENIDQIIEETLSEYYKCNVIISSKYSNNSFILNPRINMAVTSKTQKNVKKYITNGNLIQRNILLKLLSKIYLIFAFSKHNLFNCKYIKFERLPINANKILIMPGNMKIKIFDFDSMRIVNILKKNFELKSIQLEKKMRFNPSWDFVLPIEMKSSNVYYEKLLEGRSYDRLNKRKIKRINNKIEEIILQIQKEKRSTMNANKYAKSLEKKILYKLSKIKMSKNIYMNLVKIIKKLVISIDEFDMEVSFSHGDLQYGNIFITEKDEIYILDWESYDVRSIGYDLLTYFYKFRYRKNFLERIKKFLSDRSWIAIANNFYFSKIDKIQVLYLYLLEDINWIIDENLNNINKKAYPTLKLYSNPYFTNEILSIKETYSKESK